METNNNQRIMSNNNFSNAKFGDNTSFQSDNFKQTKTTVNSSTDEQIFQSLFAEVHKLADLDDQKDAQENLNKLKDAKNAGNNERAKKIFGWLPDIIKLSAAGVELAHSLGLM